MRKPKLELELVPTLKNLRDEIEAAIIEAKDQDVVFEVNNIDIELKLAIDTIGSVEAGFKFYVVDLKAGRTISERMVHTVKLSLTPKLKPSNNSTSSKDNKTKAPVEISSPTQAD